VESNREINEVEVLTIRLLYSKYDYIRNTKLKEIIYPVRIILVSHIYNIDEPKKCSLKEAIPDFLKKNIVEAEMRNVC
jgi:hypothetical protein